MGQIYRSIYCNKWNSINIWCKSAWDTVIKLLNRHKFSIILRIKQGILYSYTLLWMSLFINFKLLPAGNFLIIRISIKGHCHFKHYVKNLYLYSSCGFYRLHVCWRCGPPKKRGNGKKWTAWRSEAWRASIRKVWDKVIQKYIQWYNVHY